jgi:hypothetical protein
MRTAKPLKISTPNPSVEGTCNGGARWLASGEAVPPSHAPHVKR